MLLNRPKAAAARTKPDPESRLSYSLFGQAFDELHFMEPASLRLGYTHPMDDGQRRTFKVKFEGEGVDDYGGPYRECFAQFAAELQATTGNRGTGAADGMGPGYGATGDVAREEAGSVARCVLPLLHPCPNRVAGVGGNRERFVLASAVARAPGNSGNLYLEMYNFFGQLVGVALRNRISLDMELAATFWKQLVGRPAGAFSDLAGVDTTLVNVASALHRLAAAAAFASGEARRAARASAAAAAAAEAFAPNDSGKAARAARADAAARAGRAAQAARQAAQCQRDLADTVGDLDWTAQLSDGSRVPLVAGGCGAGGSGGDGTEDDGAEAGGARAVRPTPRECVAYARALVGARLREGARAASAVRDGLASVVPACALRLLTWEELEWCVCGRGDVDVDLLRACTEYDDDVGPDDPHIARFWKVLRAFSAEERRRFLRFVWARSRLPPTAEEFTQKFKIQAPVGDGPRARPDTYLPKAHTCFFSLNLPRYSTEAIMKLQLLYAVNNCQDMDADFLLADSEMTGWDEFMGHEEGDEVELEL